jgi:hypothetical protein
VRGHGDGAVSIRAVKDGVMSIFPYPVQLLCVQRMCIFRIHTWRSWTDREILSDFNAVGKHWLVLDCNLWEKVNPKLRQNLY